MKTMLPSKSLFLFLALVAFASFMALSPGNAGNGPGDNRPRSWTESRASQLVFFAVLEGLYRDGVKNEDVDIIIPPGEHGTPKFDPEHFVYACPLCHPAFEAFRLYRQRGDFFGFKARLDTFGPGLDNSVREQLRNADTSQRRKAIEGLISRWVAQRLQLMRLSPAEHDGITREMEQARKQGMGALKTTSHATESRTNCPICDGSFGACKLRDH
jgi:hypothetical protein